MAMSYGASCSCNGCGSYAVNDDPDRVFCDPCYWVNIANEALLEVSRLRDAIREIKEDHDGECYCCPGNDAKFR